MSCEPERENLERAHAPPPQQPHTATPEQQQLPQQPQAEAGAYYSPSQETPTAPTTPSGTTTTTVRSDSKRASSEAAAGEAAAGARNEPLVLLPEVAAIGRPVGARRPFQRRRRSRACDACRARKTKCDTPDEGPCSACAAASLMCKFSEGGEDRRRTGPARRIRSLEIQVQELTKKLRDAEALLGATETSVRPSASPAESSSPQFPCDSPTTTGGSSGHLDRHVDVPHQGEWFIPSAGDRGGMPICSPSYNPGKRQRTHSDTWSRCLIDFNAPFIASYKEYLRHLGYPASDPDYTPGSQPQQQQQSQQQGGSGVATSTSAETERSTPRVPLLSEYPSLTGMTLPLDLRVLLPPKPFAERLREVFRRTIQNYRPVFCWDVFLEKFERAWEAPMWEKDCAVVKSVFVIVQMMLAVGSQMVETTALTQEEGVGGNGDREVEFQEHGGWKFFHIARKYADLNTPTYTPDDAMVLLLMSIYLDNASLPSPCWMITGAMARVCQDVALDKNPPPEMFPAVELESRRRLFWACYVQERKSCLKKGRSGILQDSDINILLPTVLPSDSSPSSSPTTSPRHIAAKSSLQIFTAQIHLSMLIETLISVRVEDNGGIGDLQRIQHLDERLKRIWETFPAELTDLTSNQPLELGALRPLFYHQYCRLLLYRFFTSTTTIPPLDPEFRAFCLSQSLQVSKITTYLILRASKGFRSEEEFYAAFGLRTDQLVHLLTFRAAVILLLGHTTNDPPAAPREEVELCRCALGGVAKFHHLGQRLLNVFEEFAATCGYNSPPPPNVVIPRREEVRAKEPALEATIRQQRYGNAQQQQQQQQQWGVYNNGQHYQQYEMTPTTTTGGGGGASGWQAEVGGGFGMGVFGEMGTTERERDSAGGLQVDWEVVQQALGFEQQQRTAAGQVEQGVGVGSQRRGFWGY